MAFITEEQVRARSSTRDQTLASSSLLVENMLKSATVTFDIFLSHAIADAVLVLGVKRTLEASGKTVYVDWINDPTLNREHVNEKTAQTLRGRMRQSASLMYLYSRHSQQSRWMPWELGYFDGYNGNVAILPVVPSTGTLDFTREEYLLLYPKVDFTSVADVRPTLWINRSRELETGYGYKSFDEWRTSPDKLRPE